MTSFFRRSSALSFAPLAPAFLAAAVGLSVATTHGATSEGGGSRSVLAYMAASSVLWRCRVERGDMEAFVDVITEGAGESTGCRTQLNSA